MLAKQALYQLSHSTIFFLKTGSFYVPHAGLELEILLPQCAEYGIIGICHGMGASSFL
jgi:hypothetical protein